MALDRHWIIARALLRCSARQDSLIGREAKAWRRGALPRDLIPTVIIMPRWVYLPAV